jgi:hypothetical protein
MQWQIGAGVLLSCIEFRGLKLASRGKITLHFCAQDAELTYLPILTNLDIIFLNCFQRTILAISLWFFSTVSEFNPLHNLSIFDSIEKLEDSKTQKTVIYLLVLSWGWSDWTRIGEFVDSLTIVFNSTIVLWARQTNSSKHYHWDTIDNEIHCLDLYLELSTLISILPTGIVRMKMTRCGEFLFDRWIFREYLPLPTKMYTLKTTSLLAV